jgi:hypothetical protein
VKAAVCPAVTVWFTGCVVIVGATAAAFTVNVAAPLVTVPAVFVTTTRNVDPERLVPLMKSPYGSTSDHRHALLLLTLYRSIVMIPIESR